MKKIMLILAVIITAIGTSFGQNGSLTGFFKGKINNINVNLKHTSIVSNGNVESILDGEGDIPTTWWIISVTASCGSFANPIGDEVLNLYAITGGNFKRTLSAKFSSGETATSVSTVTNNGENSLYSETDWNGNLPKTPINLEIKDIYYEMSQVSDGVIAYNGRVNYIADGKSVFADVNVKIEYSGDSKLNFPQSFTNKKCSVKKVGTKTTFNLLSEMKKL